MDRTRRDFEIAFDGNLASIDAKLEEPRFHRRAGGADRAGIAVYDNTHAQYYRITIRAFQLAAHK
jgi:hypothetical protein